MANITLRSVKGSPLTNTEVDGNFSALNTELATKANSVSPSLTTPTLGVASATSLALPNSISLTNPTAETLLINAAAATATMRFRVAGDDRLTITAAGNVGIGTSAPGSRLEVSGTTRSTALVATGTAVSTVTTQLSTVEGEFQLNALNGVTGADSGTVKATLGLYYTGNLNGGIQFTRGGDGVTGWMNFLTSGTEKMRIDSAGNVGIGTSAPSAKLNVAGDTVISGNADARQIGFNFYGTSQYNFYTDGAVDAAKMTVRRGTTSVATFDSAGNVGIGTIAPSVKLHVTGGSIWSDTSVQVVKNGSDSIGDGPYFNLRNVVNDNSWATQLGASNTYNFWNFAAATGWQNRITFTAAGNVGIGTTSVTTSRVQIKGINNTTNAFGDGLKVTSANETVSTQYSWAGINATDTLLFATGGTERMRIASSGIVTAAIAFNAPVFNDSNDSNYYTNPFGTSNLLGLTVANTITGSVSGSAASATTAGSAGYSTYSEIRDTRAGQYTPNDYQDYRASYEFTDKIVGSDWHTAFTMQGWHDGYAAWQIVGPSSGTAHENFYIRSGVNTTWNALRTILHSGNYTSYAMPSGASATNSVEVRAPIFKDSNNSAFYLDPDSTSVLNTVKSGSFGTRNDISVDNGFGIYFNENMLNNYAIYRGPGTWDWPYPDLRIGFHTGIQIGANASYQGVRFYTDFDMVTQVMSVNNGSDALGAGNVYVNNSLQAGVSLRAPVFYNTPDTAFYVDADATSVLSALTLGGRPTTNAVYYSGFSLDANTMAANSTGFTYSVNAPATGPIARLGDGGYSLQLNAPYAANGAKLFYRTRQGDAGTFNAWFSVATYDANYGSGELYATKFSDAVNSGYYLNPDSTSALYDAIVIGPNPSWSQYLRIGGNGQASDMATVAASNGNLHIDSKTGFHTYLNYSSTGNILLNTGGGYTESATSIRSPIFYNFSDTAYYVDANAISQLYGLAIRGDMAGADSANQIFFWGGGDSTTSAIGFKAPLGEFANPTGSGDGYNTYLTMDAEGRGWVFRRGVGGTDFTSAYTSGWILNNGIWQANASMRAPIFYDSVSTGYYLDAAVTSNLNAVLSYSYQGNGNVGGTGNASWHPSGVYSAGYNWLYGGIGAGGGDISNVSYIYASVFSDRDNTTYYLDATGLSNINGNGSVNGSAAVGLNIYATGANGAIMAFHRAGNFAINMGLDSDNVFRIGGWSMAANRLQMDSGGNLTMAGNVTAYSDARLKENIVTVTDALNLVGRMRGVTYIRKDTGEAGVGVIAQEMLEILPQVVQQGIGDDDTLSVAYGNIVGVLIEAIKELENKVTTIESRLH